MCSGVARGGQGGTYVPGRLGIGAPKWGLQKFHNKGKKPITSKIAPAADIYSYYMANCRPRQTTYVDCRRRQAHEVARAPSAAHAPMFVVITWPKKLAGKQSKN